MKFLKLILITASLVFLLLTFFSVGHGVITCGPGKSSARDMNDALNMRNAINAYYTEYRRFPVSPEIVTGVVELRSDNELLKFLMPDESNKGLEASPRGIVFLTGRVAKKRGDSWFGGFVSSEKGTELFDRFGNHFRVKIDLDMKGVMVPPDGGVPVSDPICIWSAGKDGDYDTWKDNAKTW